MGQLKSMNPSRPLWIVGGERIAGLVLCILCWPLMLLIALLIRVTSSGRVLLVDEYSDEHGDLVRTLRFRTTGSGSSAFRHIGRFLRKYAIDELPGLWSVASGEVALRDLMLFRRHR